jgi:hypothetical protein
MDDMEDVFQSEWERMGEAAPHDQQSEIERLRAENESLKKCCTQRGARMQIMRDWMDSNLGLGGPSEWWYLVEERPEAAEWFDTDGVPK